ncbi:hypothetical protein [Alicyclobacillus sp.]|uniref:hypothetical protein n=1 Tax=Alicyclobacillus sp. TaxID=61169 RepID=UPI0025C5C3AF|nr:hypothetical protein [Alicyclobacillus sp.]MCL6517756.1 hypothetical protein [Alicyclobacillus sp.]
MLALISHHLGMLVALWIVLILTGLNLVVQVIKGLTGRGSWQDMASAATHPLLHHILPLLILAGLTTLDPTHFLILIWYYLAALLVIIADLLNLSQYIKR